MLPGGQMAVGARVWPRSRRLRKVISGGVDTPPVKFEIRSSRSETPAGESAKLPGGVWRTRSWSQVIPGDHLPGRKRASPPLLNASRPEFLTDFLAADMADPPRRGKMRGGTVNVPMSASKNRGAIWWGHENCRLVA